MYEACTRTFILLRAMPTNLGELNVIVLDGFDSSPSCVLLHANSVKHTLKQFDLLTTNASVSRSNWVRLLVW